MTLEEKYEITKWEWLYLACLRRIRGTANPPMWLFDYSLKKCGWKDNIARYYLDKYSGVPIGKYTWGYKYVKDICLHSVGAFSSIASGQHIVPNGHKVDYVSTWNSLLDYKSKLPLEKSIKIGNDVWIGGHSIIRSNVTIGDGAIIGAGSVITKDVAPYTVVVGGNRVVKQRFSDNVVEALLEMEWWNWEDEKIINSIPYWSDVNEFIARYKDN